MNYTNRIKKRIINNVTNDYTQDTTKYKILESAIIFNDLEDNFLSSSFKNILSNPNWKYRTNKIHPQFNTGIKEMQSSNSSDALLMNIFCNENLKNWTGIRKLLDVQSFDCIEFGWNPILKNENPNYRTEIDMKINNHIFESKLIEKSFKEREINIIEKYEDFRTVFDIQLLEHTNLKYKNYQLIRNILTAYKYDYSFSIIIDETRIDLIKELISIMKAIKIKELRNKISFFTWQEIASVCGKELKEYLERKYF